jgi:TRIAP1/MDM35 family protein
MKKAYDSCFNHWFDEYLQLAAPIPPTAGKGNPKVEEERQAKIKAKAVQYEEKCGATWKAYRDCLEVREHQLQLDVIWLIRFALCQDGLQEKDLKGLIREARQEFPLKVPKDVDMDSH